MQRQKVIARWVKSRQTPTRSRNHRAQCVGVLQKPTSCLRKAQARNSNLLFLPDLHSLNLFKGQLVPRSIINPGGRRTGMSGDPLRDLDCAARIHVFGNARRTEAVTTNSFQDPAGLRPFLNQLQHTPTIQASQFNCFTILAEGRKKWSTRV